MAGIPPETLNNLRSLLIHCAPVSSNAELKRSFIDERISEWKIHIPEADNESARVDGLIEYLTSVTSPDGIPGILAFLNVLQGSLLDQDACKNEIQSLISDLQKLPITAWDRSNENISREGALSWPMIKNACAIASANDILFLKNKYNESLYVERELVHEHIEKFLDHSDTQLLILRGRSGIGKSTLLYKLQQDFQQHPDYASLVIDCGHIQYLNDLSDFNVLAGLENSLEVSKSDSSNASLLRMIGSARNKDQKLIIIFDAINESKNLAFIVQYIAELINLHYPWIKIIISCRSNVWETLHDTIFNDANPIPHLLVYRRPNKGFFIDVEPFSDNEVQMAFDKHKEKYGFSSEPFDKLDHQVRSRLKEPLTLWLISIICADKRKSLSINEVTRADVSIIPQFIETILFETGEISSSTIDKEYLKRIYYILKTLIPSQMIDQENNCHNRIMVSDLLSKFPEIEKDVLYLKKLSILEENSGILKFRFERFYDYFFGEHLRVLVQTIKGEINCKPEFNISYV